MRMPGFSINANERCANTNEIATVRMAAASTMPVAPRSLVAIAAGTVVSSVQAVAVEKSRNRHSPRKDNAARKDNATNLA